MPLLTCPDCRREMSTAAPACPHCGSPRHESQAAKWIIGILAGIGLGLIVLFFLFNSVFVIKAP